jgi:hypothetical protein
MRRVDRRGNAQVRHRGKAKVLAIAAAAVLASGCGVEKPYQRLDASDRGTTPELQGDRTPLTCADVDPNTWLVAPATASAVDLVRADDVPAVPGAEPTKGTATSSTDLGSPDAVANEDRRADEPEQRAALAAGGFETGISTGFGNAPIPHRVRALRFRDAAGALGYSTQQMPRVCRAAGTIVFPLGESGGMAYADDEGRGVGIFVLGREQVTLVLPADTDGDLVALIQGWYEAWLAAHATGPAAPVG